MNKLKASIANKIIHDDLIILELDLNNDVITSIILNSLDTDYLDINQKVYICFKETEVSISKDLNCRLSIRNKLKSIIKKITKGKILTIITLDYKGFEINSIITTKSYHELDLKLDDTVEALIKTNDITLMKI